MTIPRRFDMTPKNKLLLEATAVVLTLIALHRTVQCQTLVVDPADNPLRINGVLDSQTTTFGGNVRLTLSDPNNQEVLVLPSDLRCTSDPNIKIDRSNVTIPSHLILPKDQQRDVRVTVTNVMRPCEYEGTVKFLISEQPQANALEVNLKLKITARPDVKPVVPNPAFQVARCGSRVGCALANWLLPSALTGDQRTVQLDNPSLSEVKVTGMELLLRGEKTGSVVTSTDVLVPAPPQIPAGKVSPVVLQINRSSLPADRYQGTLRLQVHGLDQPINVNLTMDVRNGPLLALLVLLAGIIVGRLVQSMSTPEAQSQIKLMRRYYTLQTIVDDVHNENAHSYLIQQMENIRRRIELAAEPEETLNQELKKFETYAQFFLNIELIEQQLKALGLEALEAELAPKIRECRLALMNDDINEAEQLRKEVEARLREAAEDSSMGPSANLLKAAVKGFQQFGNKLAELTVQPVTRPTSRVGERVRNLIVTLAGSPRVRTEARYWIARPLLFLILLVILVLIGLQTLYINVGATFGAGGVYDYLGLFIWGLSADVAQRTLQSLQLPK
jgi:hypothetical protein